MSADNIVLVKQLGKTWYVLHTFASVETTDYDFLQEGTMCPSREVALAVAHEMEHNIGYVEYGVHEVCRTCQSYHHQLTKEGSHEST